ncbi:type II secretion system F family protein [Aeromicrobium sp. CF3.5]|uniref:type II secretion system F family protein n=1 Tax=Aeromicrobium sp. CF3.5 TaxID=3373078 RepID=UPI003EE50D0D
MISPVLYLVGGLLLLAIAACACAYAFDLFPAGRADVRNRLLARDGVGGARATTEAGGFNAERGSLGVWRHAASAKALKAMERNLSIAGKPLDSLRTLLIIKTVAPFLVAFTGWAYVKGTDNPLIWIGLLIGVFAAYQYPNIYCASRATEQQAAMVATLPDVLDQITIALDAGMSFEAAFARVGATNRGPLGPQIVRTVQDLAIGMPRREAYLALAERNDVDDLTQLMRSLVQAEEFGVPIAQVVRLQADEMRDKRRQRAAAKAQTVPLKLLFPMMSCFLPVLFIILLTPAVMNLGAVL